MKYLRLPYFFVIYIIYSIVRMFVLLLITIFIQTIEFGMFTYQLIRYRHIIKEKLFIDFISERPLDLKGRFYEFLDLFVIEGF